MENNKLVLVTNKICPFAQRVWLALEESGAQYELKETPLGTPTSGGAKPQWFSEVYRSAMGTDQTSDGKVPVLIDGDFTLTESAIVADYVSAKFANSSLLPSTPRERAESSLFQEQVMGKVVGAFYAALKGTSGDEETRIKTKDAFMGSMVLLSATLAKNSGPFLLGSRLSLADLLVWPFLARAIPLLKHYRALEVPDAPEFDAYHLFVSAMKERKSVQATDMPDEYFIEGYRQYAYPAA